MRTPVSAALAAAALLALAACGSEPAERAPDTGAVAVRVGGIAVDPRANAPVVILEEVGGSRQLPIWIGLAEARSILAGLHRDAPVRPNTHDLAQRLLDGLEADVQRVIVRTLEDGIYYADVVLLRGGRELRVDARPSDAIALAVRVGAPVFVLAPLFEAEPPPPDDDEEGRRIRAAPPASGRQLPVRSL